MDSNHLDWIQSCPQSSSWYRKTFQLTFIAFQFFSSSSKSISDFQLFQTKCPTVRTPCRSVCQKTHLSTRPSRLKPDEVSGTFAWWIWHPDLRNVRTFLKEVKCDLLVMCITCEFSSFEANPFCFYSTPCRHDTCQSQRHERAPGLRGCWRTLRSMRDTLRFLETKNSLMAEKRLSMIRDQLALQRDNMESVRPEF